MSEQKQVKIVHLVIFLTVLGALCALVLASVNYITSSIISKNEEAALTDAFKKEGLENIKEIETEKTEGLDALYEATFDGVGCYVVKGSNKNSYTTISALVVIEKERGVIIKIVPFSGDPSFTTHGLDSSFVGNSFSIGGYDKDTYENYFTSVSGATVSSSSIKEIVSLAFRVVEEVK